MELQLKDSPFAEAVEIKLGDHYYEVCFPLPATWALEDACGIKISEGELTTEKFAALGVRERMKFTAQMCWAGLLYTPDGKARVPQLTFDEVAAKISMRNLAYIDGKVGTAYKAAQPEFLAPKNGDRPLANSGGQAELNSGPSPVTTSDSPTENSAP
jgi:hypothetical protein